MQYSISTHCLIDKPLPEALETLAPYTKHTEIMSDGLHWLENGEILSSFDFKYSLHAPSRGVNISSVLEPIREAAVKVIVDTFAVAAEFDATTVVHPGFFSWEYDKEKAENNLKKSVTELQLEAKELGVKFVVENMGNWGYFFLKTPADIPLMNNAGFCLDVGHANEVKSLDKFLEIPFEHIHIHDNLGDKDSHLAVGKGNIDFAKVLEKIKENNVRHPVIETESLNDALLSIERLKGLGI